MEKNLLPEDVRQFCVVRHRLSIDEDNIVLYGCRILIHHSQWHRSLQTFHASHQGIEYTKCRARLAVYWPGIDQGIKNIVRGCQACSAELPSQAKGPLYQHPRPECVFQHMCSDLFSWARQELLVITNVKSGWPSTFHMGKSVTAQDLVEIFRKVFVDTAMPTILCTDNGFQ